MPTLDAPGAPRLHVLDVGSGRPIVLVHGWALSHAAFRPQVEALSASFRVVAPDLRGHGASEAAGECALVESARDLETIAGGARLEGAVLVGWSWGAEIVLAALPSLRERIAAVALVSATPRFTSAPDWPHGLPEARVRALRARLARAPHETRRAFVEGMFAEGELPAAERSRIVREQLEAPLDVDAARATLDALASADLRDRVRDLAGIPLLLVHGDRDAICLPAASEWMLEQVPGARREVLPGAGHAPQLSRAAEVSSLIAALARSVR